MKTFFFVLNSFITGGFGDWSSVLGLIVGIVGFMITIITIFKVKSASEQGKIAAEQARDQIKHVDTISELSSIISFLSEVKWLQRHDGWEVLPEKYSRIRCSLIVIKTGNKAISEIQSQSIQGTIQILAQIEKKIEESMAADSIPNNIARLNTTISKQIDKLQQILSEIKSIKRS